MTALMCPDCGQAYTAIGGHCRGGQYGGCCQSFTSGGAFDEHRTGPYTDRRCRTVDEMRDRGMRCVNGRWTTSSQRWAPPTTTEEETP